MKGVKKFSRDNKVEFVMGTLKSPKVTGALGAAGELGGAAGELGGAGGKSAGKDMRSNVIVVIKIISFASRRTSGFPVKMRI